MRQRVLLLMGTRSYKAQAFLEAAARLGVDAVVASEQPSVFADANPRGLLTFDFSNLLEAATVARKYHDQFPVEAALACDDEGVRAAAAIQVALGLAGSPLRAVEQARDKRLMREAFASAGLPTPWYEVFPVTADPGAVAAQVRYPCVLKPPTLSASRGVVRANDPADCVAAFRAVTHIIADAGLPGSEAEVLVEEYLPGEEIAVEGLLSAGALRVLAIFDKPDPLVGPTFEETIYVTPSRHAPERLAAATLLVAGMATALGLTHGAVHAEVRFDGARCWPIEIAPRSIGGLCSRALRFGEGHSLEELLLRHALGEDVGIWLREPDARGVMMVPVPRAGILHGVRGIEQALGVAGITDVRVTIPIGHPVLPPPEGNRYLGFLFATGDVPEDVERSLRKAHGELHFEIHTE